MNGFHSQLPGALLLVTLCAASQADSFTVAGFNTSAAPRVTSTAPATTANVTTALLPSAVPVRRHFPPWGRWAVSAAAVFADTSFGGAGSDFQFVSALRMLPCVRRLEAGDRPGFVVPSWSPGDTAAATAGIAPHLGVLLLVFSTGDVVSPAAAVAVWSMIVLPAATCMLVALRLRRKQLAAHAARLEELEGSTSASDSDDVVRDLDYLRAAGAQTGSLSLSRHSDLLAVARQQRRAREKLRAAHLRRLPRWPDALGGAGMPAVPLRLVSVCLTGLWALCALQLLSPVSTPGLRASGGLAFLFVSYGAWALHVIASAATNPANAGLKSSAWLDAEGRSVSLVRSILRPTLRWVAKGSSVWELGGREVLSAWREAEIARWFPAAHAARCGCSAVAVALLPLGLPDSQCAVQLVLASVSCVVTAAAWLVLRPHRAPARRWLQLLLVFVGTVMNFVAIGSALGKADDAAIEGALAVSDAVPVIWLAATCLLRVVAGPCVEGPLPEDPVPEEAPPPAPQPRRAPMPRPAGAAAVMVVPAPRSKKCPRTLGPPDASNTAALLEARHNAPIPTPSALSGANAAGATSNTGQLPFPTPHRREPAWFRNAVGDYVGPRGPPTVVDGNANQGALLLFPLEWGPTNGPGRRENADSDDDPDL
jgi:hypothetical protein